MAQAINNLNNEHDDDALADDNGDIETGKLNSCHASDKVLLPSWMHMPKQMSKDSTFYAERRKWVQSHINIEDVQSRDGRRLFVELHKYYLRTQNDYAHLWERYIQQ